MRISILLLSLGGLMAAGCFSYSAPPPPPATMTAWSPTGGFAFSSGGGCSGQVGLVGGFATVNDPCFSGSTDVVVCSDNSAPNPVKCAPSMGSLLLSGTGRDYVSYARIR